MDFVPYDPAAEILPVIDREAEERGVPIPLARALFKQESGYNPNAVNSETGATGLGQLMPETAGDIDRTDPVANIKRSLDYLKEGHDREGSTEGALQYYYGGPNKDKWGERTQAYPDQVLRHVADRGALQWGTQKAAAPVGDFVPYDAKADVPVAEFEPYAGSKDADRQALLEAQTAEDPFTSMTQPDQKEIGHWADVLKLPSQVVAEGAGFLGGAAPMAATYLAYAANRLTGASPEAAHEAAMQARQNTDPSAGLDKIAEMVGLDKSWLHNDAFRGFMDEFNEKWIQPASETYFPKQDSLPKTAFEDLANIATFGAVSAGAHAAKVRGAEALKATAEPASEILNATTPDEAIAAAQAEVAKPTEAPAVEPALNTALSANADARAALTESLNQPEIPNARALESESASDRGGVAPALDKGADRAPVVETQEPIPEVPARPEAQPDAGVPEGEVNVDQVVRPAEDANGAQPESGEAVGVGNDEHAVPAEARPEGGLGADDAKAGDHRLQDEGVAAEATNVAPQATFTDYTAPKNDESRGIVKGEVRTFKTEKTAQAFAQQQGIRGFTARETEDGWVLSKPTRERVPQKMTVNADDHVFDVLAKSGGMKPEAVDGADPKDVQSANRAAFLKPFRQGGMSLDGAAEVLASHGFDVLDEAGRPDAHKANELIHRAVQGEIIRSPEGQEIARAKAESAKAAALKRQGVPDGIEKRADVDTRKRVSQMTPDELRQSLLTSERTGLGNQRAYDEAPRKPVQASIDADSLKWINDTIGHEAGNQLIAEIGHAMKAEGLDSYHLSGDEFAAQFDHTDAGHEALGRVRDRLANVEITAVGPEGQRITKKGVDFSYGLGKDLATADEELRQDKRWREDAGVRAGRGEEPPGVVRELAVQARENRSEAPAGPERTAESRSGTESAVTETPARAGVSVSEPAIADVPPALMKRITVPVERFHEGGGVKTEHVPAHEALAEHDAEISAYEKLLECVRAA